MKSKAIQQTLKLTPEQTASLMADNGSDHRLRKFRTVLINGIEYSPIASQKKVDAVRKRIMAMEKEDWNFEKMLIYQNKQGKNRVAKRADRADQSVLFFLAGANFWEKHAKSC